jgi:SAM-dependent methyltransferase
MPGGFATYYVYEPHHRKMADGKRLDPITNRLFRHGIEGVGMRTRAYVLAWIVEEWSKDRRVPLRWASLGGGTGQPLYDALRQLDSSIRGQSELVLVDMDGDVVDFAQKLYDEQKTALPAGKFIHDDIFRPTLFEEIHEGNLIDGIDIMGIFEYLDDKQAVDLIKRCYENLSPNGVLIFSNMDVDRPDYEINQRVIGWPELCLRSAAEVMDLLNSVGLPKTNITHLQTDDAINNVFRVVKP